MDSRHRQEKKMAITKTTVADKIETLENGIVQVRTATVIKEDGVELTRSFHRQSVMRCGQAQLKQLNKKHKTQQNNFIIKENKNGGRYPTNRDH